MRQFNEDFNGKCCDTNFKQCDWTCEEIAQRISSRAALGTVYSRSEIDSRLNTLRSLISVAAASNSIIIDDIINRPVASPGNAGYLFITNSSIPNTGSSYFQQTFVSNGNTWIELINREDFTSESSFIGDMERSTYTNGITDHVTIFKGGTGRDLSALNDGCMIYDNGEVNTSANYTATDIYSLNLDLELTTDSASIQIISSNVNDIFLPETPLLTTYFRIINTSTTNVPLIKFNNDTIHSLSTNSAIDLHYNDTTDTWIIVSLALN